MSTPADEIEDALQSVRLKWEVLSDGRENSCGIVSVNSIASLVHVVRTTTHKATDDEEDTFSVNRIKYGLGDPYTLLP